jgi:putative FmdB family regulatory protein
MYGSMEVKFMPIYRYCCEKCGHEEKRLQSINSDPLEVCEVCGGKMVKQIGMIGIKFNGSGYYVNDNSSAKKTTTHPGTSAGKSGSPVSKTPKSSEKKSSEQKAV